jgi:hypothetical protein
MMTDNELKAALAGLQYERVTEEFMRSRIAEVKFHKLGPTLMNCTIHLDNGYTSTGESACVDPANYNKEIGEKLAYDNAFRKLWPLFGFVLAEARFHRVKNND